MVDHADSFTYNIYHLFRRLGQDVQVVDHRSARVRDCLGADAVILGPGPHNPLDLPRSIALFREIRGKKPVLGICMGHQVIGVAMGGRVRQATVVCHGVLSEIRHDGQGLFRGIGNPARFVRYHSLVLDEPLPAGLRACARDEHGDVAGIRHESLPLWGVQFHPESILSQGGKELAMNFLEMAGL